MLWRVILFCLFVLPLGSYAETIAWKEEVQLQDGRILTIDRISEVSKKVFPQHPRIEYEQTLLFTHPNTHEKISWPLPKGLGPKLLDFEGNDIFIVARPGSAVDYGNWDCPNPPFIVFRYAEKQWKTIAMDQLPDRLTTPNLLLGITTDDKASADGLVTVAELQASLERGAVQYRTISRKQVNPITKGCTKDILVRLGRQGEMGIREN
jgi:hypothetical protein